MMTKTNCFAVLALAILAVASVQATSIGSDGSPTSNREATWAVDLEDMRQKIATGRPVEVPVGGLGDYAVLLDEFSIFAPGEKMRVVVDENGKGIGYEPFPYWSYRGVLNDLEFDSEVLITMDDRGLYGFVRAFGITTRYSPVDEDHILIADESAQVRVKWREGGDPRTIIQETHEHLDHVHENPVGALDPQSDQPSPISIQYSGPYMGGLAVQCLTLDIGRVQPVADKRYATAHSNFDTRISNAFAAQADMWQKQTCIRIVKETTYAPGANLSSSSDCTTHLNSFAAAYAPDASVDASQLFTGLDMSGCNGNGYLPAASGNLALSRYSLVEAVDHSIWDLYDPDEISDLGLVSGHEIGHNWGERDHPDGARYSNGVIYYNIMKTGVNYDRKEFWFTSGNTSSSSERIIRATHNNMGP